MYRLMLQWPLPGYAEDLIEWWDPDYLVVRTIPKPSYKWDLYQEWLAEGNSPLLPGELFPGEPS